MERKILLHVKTRKDGKGRTFKTFYTFINIIVKGEESKGKQSKAVSIRFKKEVNTTDLKYGYIYVDENKMNVPYVYEIVEKKFPTIWVHKINKFEPIIKKLDEDLFIDE